MCACIEWCVCIQGLCVCIRSDVCVYALSGQTFLDVLVAMLLLEWTWLILCPAVAGTAEPVPSYQAG